MVDFAKLLAESGMSEGMKENGMKEEQVSFLNSSTAYRVLALKILRSKEVNAE